jgi:hypothetical protein
MTLQAISVALYSLRFYGVPTGHCSQAIWDAAPDYSKAGASIISGYLRLTLNQGMLIEPWRLEGLNILSTMAEYSALPWIRMIMTTQSGKRSGGVMQTSPRGLSEPIARKSPADCQSRCGNRRSPEQLFRHGSRCRLDAGSLTAASIVTISPLGGGGRMYPAPLRWSGLGSNSGASFLDRNARWNEIQLKV